MPTTTPHWRQRRLAPRSIRIVERRAKDSPVIAVFAETIVPKAKAYITEYDKCMKYEATFKKEMTEGRAAIVTLLKHIQMWAPLLKRDVPGFDGSSYGDQPQVPDDVIEDGDRMASVIDEYRDTKGNPLPYRQVALDLFTPALQAAAKEWGEAEAADSQYQQLMARVRGMSNELQTELVALRRSLLIVASRSDKDYQKLRVDRAGFPDDDDDPDAPAPPTPVVPAATGVSAPSPA